ncbi:MAG: hypothetical protein R3F55_04175 [Alphaproteobacteria bacterium]
MCRRRRGRRRHDLNTHYWCGDRGWSGVLVEGYRDYFVDLQKVYRGRDDVHCMNQMVAQTRSTACSRARLIPKRFDLLSIDVDGIDFWLWHGLQTYRPRVVIIEVNASMGPDVYFVQQDEGMQMGSSALAMVQLAQQKGYRLAAHLVSNCIFVDAEEFPLLGIDDNALPSLFTSPFVPVVVSDLNGVHHVLKPGPWGFSGAVVTPSHKVDEDGSQATLRLLQQAAGDGGSVLRVAAGERCGYSAAITQDRELLRVLKRFGTRDWSPERAALARTAAAREAEPLKKTGS